MNTIKRLWNRNFTILWQGQLISDFGNTAFTVALGFWVLNVTATQQMPQGNLALMGFIEACFALPAVVLGPLAGAVADRFNRKWILLGADFIRGLCFSAMGIMLFFNAFPFWVIYPIAIICGSSGAFFSPTLSAAIPDIVPQDSLSKANSARGLSTSLTQLLGNSLGGMLYAVLKAPLLILANGLSFLYASISQLFVRIPYKKSSGWNKQIMSDMADGLKYAFGNRGIRTMMLTGMMINFFAVIGLSLMTPLFNSTPGFGVARYGLMMGIMMAGAIIGMIVLSAIKIKPQQRSRLYGVSVMIMVCVTVPIALIYDVNWLYPLAFIAGVTNAIVNVMIQTILQSTVPAHTRGKVFGILSTVTGGLQPISLAISGVIAGIAGIRPTMAATFSILVLAALPMLLDRNIKAFINTDIAAETEDETLDAPLETATAKIGASQDE
jgi:MFS family permease